MNRAKLNFVIDALMFLCMAAIAGLGFLMKYVLVPGRETPLLYGRRVDLFFLGLDRHAWGPSTCIWGSCSWPCWRYILCCTGR
ncbi:MAG: hypothetical protein WHT07_09960 [Desulfobaccales bacterium]